MASDNSFSLTLGQFYAGYSPLAFQNSLTEFGGAGHASTMKNVDVINGEYLTQGPGLTQLTNSTETVTELVSFVMDKAVAADQSYAIGSSKLFKLSSTAVNNTSPWPHTITSCTEGESIQVLKGDLYYFYNTATGGNIGKYDLDATFDDDWCSTVPTGGATLKNAAHPSDKKEDIMVFGNGRYAGVYLQESNIIDTEKLDFGDDTTVDDVLYNAGYWYLAVNSGVTGDNRTEGQIYLYNGAALISTLSDETGVGMQRIGFLYRINGIVYVAYQDLSYDGFIIGYINGKSITPLVRFSGTLPNFQQKTLYKNTILLISNNKCFSSGSIIGELPYQLSQIAGDEGLTLGAIAAPFGTPLLSTSTTVDEVTTYDISKFTGYTKNSSYETITFPVSNGKMKGMIDEIIVNTKTLGTGARCDLKISADQGTKVQPTAKQIVAGKTRHYFNNFGMPEGGMEDFKLILDWSNGSTSNDTAIRKIIINGHYIQSI